MAPRIDRRALLGGALGLSLALPLLALAPRRAAASPFPKRLVVFFTPNGTIHEAWLPKGRDVTSSEILAPLAPHREHLVVLDGIDMESSYYGPGDGAHWNGMGQMLTATELVPAELGTFWGGGISFDQRIAQAIGQTTMRPSLELCVEPHAAGVATRMSYLGASRPVSPEHDPRAVYERLFVPLSADRREARRRVLDAVAGEIGAVGRKLGREDRDKLAAHLDAVHDIEQRLDRLPSACRAPAAPPAIDAADPALFPEVGALQMDLLVAALACDVTRVASLMWSTSVSMTSMPWLGFSDPHHDLSHKPRSDAASMAKLVRINRFYAEQLAYLLDKMRGVREGDGTLLDHSVVLWCNELSDGETHSRRGMPYVLAGSAGGAIRTGRLLRYEGAAKGHVHGALLVALARALDVPLDSFGDPAYCPGELPSLRG